MNNATLALAISIIVAWLMVACGKSGPGISTSEPDGGSGGSSLGVGGSGGWSGQTGGVSGMCTWPAAFTPTVTEQPAYSCWAYAISSPAQGSNVSCSSAEYSLGCVGGPDWELTRPVPAPDSSLSCRSLELPTPPNQSYYCCPCGQEGDADPFQGATGGIISSGGTSGSSGSRDDIQSSGGGASGSSGKGGVGGAAGSGGSTVTCIPPPCGLCIDGYTEVPSGNPCSCPLCVPLSSSDASTKMDAPDSDGAVTSADNGDANEDGG